MRTTRPKSIALNHGAQPRVYRTYEDWMKEAQNDNRTAEERGIKVGSAVTWRHRTNKVIFNDRAVVMSIAGSVITIQVKDVKEHTCKVQVREIVMGEDDRKPSISPIIPINPIAPAAAVAPAEPNEP